MIGTESYHVVLFHSVNCAMYADRLLKQKGTPYKLIPVPRHISSNCGVCIRFPSQNQSEVEEVIQGVVEFDVIRPLY